MPPPITLTSPLPATDLLFQSMTVSEGLSQLGETHLGLLSESADLPPDDLLGRPVTVNVALADGGTRYFNGYVARFGIGRGQGRHFGYHATVRPWLWFLTRTTDCRIFQEQSVPDIVKAIFADHAAIAKFEFKLFRTYRTRNYCVQYRESDFHFVARLLEDEGIYWYFEHSADEHKLVLVDDMGVHGMAEGCDALPYYAHGGQLPHDIEYISQWTATREVKPGAIALNSYDFERPSMALIAEQALTRAHELAEYEIFDFQGDFLQRDDGLQLAGNRLDELQTAHERLKGSTNAQGLRVGQLFQMTRHPREDQNGRYLCVSTTLHTELNRYEAGGEDSGWHCSFTAIPARQQFRPPRRTPKPFVQGPQTAVVVGPAGEEIFTDKFGRVKVHFHWDRKSKKNETSSCWLRVSSPWAGKSFGFVQVPRIGQEVVVDFLEGDPDQPLVTGRVYNQENMPPWELPANATQSGVLTRSSKGGGYGNANALRFEDKKGHEQVWFHAEKNMDTSVENDESRSIGHDQITTVNHHQTIVVEKGRELFVNDLGESCYVKGPRNCYYDGKQVQVVTTGYDSFVTGTRGEYTTGERRSFTTAAYLFKSTKAYFDVGPEYLLTGGKFGFVASGSVFNESGGEHNLFAKSGFKFTTPANFDFKGNQFNRTIFEGNDTVLGPNTNTYIGVSRDTAVGSASQTFIGTQNSVTTGMSIDGYLGMQISNFVGLALSNAVAISMDNAAINLGMTGIDLTVNGISLDNNAMKLLNAGGASGPGAAVAFSAGPGIAAAAAALFGLGFGLGFAGSMSIDAYDQAKKDIKELMDTPGLTDATIARLQRVLDQSSGFSGGNPTRTAEGYRADAANGQDAQIANLIHPPGAPGATPPPGPPKAPEMATPETPRPPAGPGGAHG